MMPSKRKIKWTAPAALILLSVVLAAAGLTAWYFLQTPKLLLTGKNSFHVGEEVHLSDLIAGVKNGELATNDYVLDSAREGEVSVAVALRGRTGREVTENVTITFWRETPVPVITAPAEWNVTAFQGQEPPVFDPLEGVFAVDEDGKSYDVSVEGTYTLSEAGSYPITYVVLNRDGSRVTREAVVTVTTITSPFDQDGNMIDGHYKTTNGFDLVIENGIATVDGILLVNKSYSLPKGFSSTGDGTRTLRPETVEAWNEMRAAAPAEIQQKLRIRSGVRNIADQTVIFNNYVKENGLEKALTFSAKPGHSEHHTGLAMDITTASSEEARSPEVKPVMDWLNENAWKYGFIKRYPEGKSDETGYIFEPWHYRYVGVELAAKLYNGGDWITLEAYFGVDSEYKN